MPILTIPYGTADRQPHGPVVTIDTAARDLLRLNDGEYTFDDVTRAPGPGAAERLAFLRDHLIDLCDLWAKRPRQFVALYFRFIDTVLEREQPALERATKRLGGLFAWQDYAFSALRPLPRAHLPAGSGSVRVDFAFWDGEHLVAVDVASDEAKGAAWDSRRAALDAAGIQRIEIPAAEIARDDPALLIRRLPPAFAAFWNGETMPSSPFKASGLGDAIDSAPDF